MEPVKHKLAIADRLLHKRSQAGSDAGRHARYHALVNRYQRVLLKNHLFRYRSRFLAHWRHYLGLPWLRRLLNRHS